MFCYENKLVSPIYVSDQEFGKAIDLLHVINENKSQYVHSKDFNRFIFHKTKNKNKKYFCERCLWCFSSKNVFTKYKDDCLGINGKQSVRPEKGTIEFKNYFKQIPVLFKIYADFESNLNSGEIYEDSYSKKYQDHDPCSFACKLVCIDNKLSKLIVVVRGKNAAYEFIKTILTEYQYCKQVMKKNFNKNFIMSYEEEEQLQSSNKCWICENVKNSLMMTMKMLEIIFT